MLSTSARPPRFNRRHLHVAVQLIHSFDSLTSPVSKAASCRESASSACGEGLNIDRRGDSSTRDALPEVGKVGESGGALAEAL
jgi:hypothetical protein